MDKDRITVPADSTYLPQVMDFVEGCMMGASYSSRTKYQIELAVEEIFVNIARYAYENEKGEVSILCRLQPGQRLILSFSDMGRQYNPLKHPEPDIHEEIGQRVPGGLGIYLTKKNMDALAYEYRDGKNVLTMEKALGENE